MNLGRGAAGILSACVMLSGCVQGKTALIRLLDEVPGANCATGGKSIAYGVDGNGDGSLSVDEITSTQYVCNGAAGPGGPSGSKGETGPAGMPGSTEAGYPGTSALILTAAATVEQCPGGGTVIKVGVDDDRDGVLDVPGEVDSTEVVCNGLNGAAGANGANGVTYEVNVSDATVQQCAEGGKVLQYFVDADNDDVVDAGEALGSAQVVCNGLNGAAGANGANGLTYEVNVAEATVQQCAAGGKVIQYFLDADNDDVVDAGEAYGSAQVMCNGTPGSNGANGVTYKVAASSASVQQCTNGGQVFQYYVDADNDGSLDAGEEIGGPQVLCNGLNGSAGANGDDGYSALVNEAKDFTATSSCPYGTTTVSLGLDNGEGGGTARNGTLEAGEVDSTFWGCLGEDADGDGKAYASDNCPGVANADQADADTDAVGDACDSNVCNVGSGTTLKDCDDTAAVSCVNTETDAAHCGSCGNACGPGQACSGGMCQAPPPPSVYDNRTVANSGLGNNTVLGVYAVGSTVYAATTGGLSISTNGGTTFTNKTTADGLGSNSILGVYAVGSTVYAATTGGLSISTNGGQNFTNRTVANSGLGDNSIKGVYVVGSTVYAATNVGGLGISTDGGTSFTNKTTADGLGNNTVYGVYAVGSTVYAATTGGLSISTNGGTNFTNRTTTDGLGNVIVNGVYVVGSTVYAATSGGLSISTDGGATFTNRTVANSGLGNNNVRGVYVEGSTLYAVSTGGGVSFSTNGGTSFTNKTTADGLGSNVIYGVHVVNGTVYAATSGGLSIGTP